MNFIRSLRDLAGLVLALQWAWHLGVFGYAKMGVIGAILGVMLSAPLIAIAPFTAWLLMDRAQTIWFYLLLATITLCALVMWFFKRRIYDESGREIG